MIKLKAIKMLFVIINKQKLLNLIGEVNNKLNI